MNSTYLGYTYLFTSIYDQIEKNMDDWKNKIRKEWKESANYPRKKKKRIRKSLLLDWQIANYNIFD